MSSSHLQTSEPGLEWEASAAEHQARSVARAWRLAAILLGTNTLSATALLVALPLKQTIPYLISVDRLTGQSEVVSLAADQSVSLRMTEAKYWISQYVKARERFDLESIPQDFSAVVRWSDAKEASIYQTALKNAIAEQKKSGSMSSRVNILSIGLVDDRHAVVRFERVAEGRTSDSSLPVNTRATATLEFSLTPPLKAPERDLIENPLGFQVQRYRVDTELLEMSDR